jgi:glycosyltransferase involved in cell wall biosynthesis
MDRPKMTREGPEQTRQRLLVLSSTFPARRGDPTPGFVRDLAEYEASHFDTLVVVPRVRGADAGDERDGDLRIRRFAYFPRRWEGLADGAIIENLRRHRRYWLQVVPFFAAEILAVRRAVREHRPDVVHVHWLVPQGVAALVGARRAPWVVTTLGADLYTLRDPISRALKRAVVRRARSFTTQNDDMRRQLVDLGAAPEDVHVLPVPVDMAAMQRATEATPREPGLIVFVGRLVEKKGVHVLLDACRALLRTHRFEVLVCGDGPMRAELTERAEGLPVTFAGALGREDVARSLARASIAAFPSVPATSGDQDGLPVAMLEAMAAGTPVVASRLPGLDEAIDDDDTGLLVRPNDPEALALALARVLDDDALRQRLGSAAQRRARDYSIEATGARFVSLLERAGDHG